MIHLVDSHTPASMTLLDEGNALVFVRDYWSEIALMYFGIFPVEFVAKYRMPASYSNKTSICTIIGHYLEYQSAFLPIYPAPSRVVFNCAAGFSP